MASSTSQTSIAKPKDPRQDLLCAFENHIQDRMFSSALSIPLGPAITSLRTKPQLKMGAQYGHDVLSLYVGAVVKRVFHASSVEVLTIVSDALLSNVCLTKLAHKIGIASSATGRAAVDSFEVYANAMYDRLGEGTIEKWVNLIFEPMARLALNTVQNHSLPTEMPDFYRGPEEIVKVYQKYGWYHKQWSDVTECITEPDHLVVSSFKLPEPKELGFTEGTVVRLESNLVRIWLPVFRKHMNVSIEHPCIYRATFEGSRLHVDWWPSEDERSCNSKLVQESYCLRGQMNVDVQECKLPNGGTYLRASLSHPLEIEA